jgi:quercetin dioxygenase-like cupin family protein
MRRVVTGISNDGKSTVRSDGPPPTAFHAWQDDTVGGSMAKTDGPWTGSPVPANEAVVHQLWALSAAPAAGVADPTVAFDAPDFELPTAATQWILTEMGPNLFTPMHFTVTVDYGLVIEGEVEIGLEDGTTTLRAGDAIVVDGVRHSWRAGKDGCKIATVQVGIPAAPTA